MYAFEVQLVGYFRKGGVRIFYFLYCQHDFFVVDVLNDGFVCRLFEFMAKCCAVCFEKKSQLVNGDFFQEVHVEVADDFVYKQQFFRRKRGIFVMQMYLVLSDQGNEKIFQRKSQQLFASEQLFFLFFR